MINIPPRFRPSPNRALPDWQKQFGLFQSEFRELRRELREVRGAVDEWEAERRAPVSAPTAAADPVRPAPEGPVAPPAPVVGPAPQELAAMVHALRDEARAREQQQRRVTAALQQQVLELRQTVQALAARLLHRL
jgi:hypothetical protein